MNLIQKKNNTSDLYLVRQIKSFKYAFRGLYFALGDYNFLVHIPSAILVVIVAWFFNVNTVEWLFLISAIFGVWVCEILNTSIELLTDMISPDFHVMAGKIKDLAAGAVLLTTVYAVLVACVIFIPYLNQILNK